MNNEALIGSLASPVGPKPLVDALPIIEAPVESKPDQDKADRKIAPEIKSRFGEFSKIERNEFKAITEAKPIPVKTDSRPSSILASRSLLASSRQESGLPILKSPETKRGSGASPLAERKPSRFVSSIPGRSVAGKESRSSSLLSNRSFTLNRQNEAGSLPVSQPGSPAFQQVAMVEQPSPTKTVSSLPPLKAESPRRDSLISHRVPINNNPESKMVELHPVTDGLIGMQQLPGVKKIESFSKGSSFSSLPRSKPIIDSLGESISQLVALLASHSHHEIVDPPHYSHDEFADSSMYHRG